ncbi:hypothetical protein [Nocardia sp. NPDC049526]|uniref:hypothetical protein n=1 Tax=Nocardia sp. NPDC049526 TaxID=3364316 RepID=UPI0037AE91F3
MSRRASGADAWISAVSWPARAYVRHPRVFSGHRWLRPVRQACRPSANALPSFYQLGTQLGTPRYAAPHLAGLPPLPGIQDMCNYVPSWIPLRFDPEAMPDIDLWVRQDGTGLIFVYGQKEPARAKPFRLGPVPTMPPSTSGFRTGLHWPRRCLITASRQHAVLTGC